MQKRRLNYAAKNEIVLEMLREDIFSRRLEAGKRYSATEIAERLNISKTPVNYAILILAEQGLIKLHPNVGFEVKKLEWSEVEELMLIKSAMEKIAIKRLVPIISSDDIKELRLILNKIRSAINDDNEQEYFAQTKVFYFSILSKAGNVRSLEYYKRYWDYEGFYATRIAEHHKELLELCDSHGTLIDAFERKDIDLALSIADKHVSKSLSFLKKVIDESEKLAD